MLSESKRAAMGVFLRRYGLLIVIIGLVIGSLFGFMAGWRLTLGGPVRVGTLVVPNLPVNSFVYIDEMSRVAAIDGEAETDLLPGHHSVIVAAPGMQPWNDLISIDSGTTIQVQPILVHETPAKQLLTGEERNKAATLMTRLPLPTKDAPLRMNNNCVHVYVERNTILADVDPSKNCDVPYLCENGTCATTIITSSNDAIHAVIALPGHDDALAVASGSLLYALELDPRSPRFYAPLFRGTGLRAAPWSVGTLVASDGQNAYVITP